MSAIQPTTTAALIDEAQIERLASTLRGQIIRPGDPDYEAARRVYNAMIDQHPALIVRPADVADVMATVTFAHDHALPLAVRGGGHNVAGFGTVEAGLVLDLSLLRAIRIDPQTRTARVEGGCTWGEVDQATHAFGLATPSGIISTTGVGGLTLGGGFGHLARHYGLACDNLLAANLVTADGQLRTVSATQHPDLFWALRGGGGNFGVVTAFTFQLHPVDTVYGGPIFYPVEHTTTLLPLFRDLLRQAPIELSAFFSFHQGPPAPFIPEHLHFVPMVAIVVCYSGADLAQGEALIQPLRTVVEPLVDLAGPLPYPALNSLFDALYPPGLHHYWKAAYVPTLTDTAIAVHAHYGPQVPSLPSTMHLYPQTGAIQQVAPEATAYAQRNVEFVHNIVAIDANPANLPRNMAWMQSYYDALRPSSAPGGYVNFLMANEGAARITATYGANYARLVAIKTTYDPDNLFRRNQNIKPRA